ncbi:MAG TPA: TIGR03118 family protein [Verrucomicrobiae bacterium]|nr:TIGR03118 family protein [Verrucomicrobiae bacterium]
MNTKTPLRAVFSLGLSLAVCGLLNVPPCLHAATVNVSVVDFAFTPASVTINQNDEVTWNFSSANQAPHSSTSDGGLWDSGILGAGAGFSHTFNLSGNFPYHCTVHPFMTASVTVQAPPTPPPPTNNPPPVSTASGYVEGKLVADMAGNAFRTDARLVNPWGLVAGPDLIVINDNGTGITTVYGPIGQLYSFDIQIPAPGGGTSAPSGLVLNDTSAFVVNNAGHQAPSQFLMSTEDGAIIAWNHQINGSNAVIAVDNSASGAVYKGLDIARDMNGNPQIYAANFHVGVVDVFDSSFQYVSSFTDSNLPPNFAPFNIRNVQGYLLVSFALQKLPDAHDDAAGPGNGFLDLFDTDGTLLRRFTSQGALNSPWGLAVAPANFGEFSNALLVGNFGDGKISAYNLLTGKWLGYLKDTSGNDVVVDGLWGLSFQRSSWEDSFNVPLPRLYFSSGPNAEADGLMGYLRPLNTHFPAAH